MSTTEMDISPQTVENSAYITWQTEMQRMQAIDSNSMWPHSKPPNSRFSTLTVFNHKPIVCNEAALGDGWAVTQMTVLKVDDAGFSKAPFSKTLSKAKLALAKPLAVIEAEALRLYTFEKASMSKGPRCDDISVCIEVGDVFVIFMDSSKFKMMTANADKSQHLLPTDGPSVIPPFSLLQMTVSSKNADTCSKGSIVNIQSIRLLEQNITLNSCFPMLRKLPATLNDSLVRANDKAQLYPQMSKDLVRDNTSFFREHCNPNASVDLAMIDDDPFIRVTDWSLDPIENFTHVDMSAQEVLRLTNCTNVEHALNFLTIAFAMNAVSLLVVHNDYWSRGGNSNMRGTPIISWQKMLKCIDVNASPKIKAKANKSKKGEIVDANTVNDFCTNEYYDDGDGPQMIMMHVDCMETEIVSEDAVTATDFPIVFPDMRVEKGYACSISLAANNDLPTPRPAVHQVVRFTINTGYVNQPTASRNFKRRKLASLQ
jgi:hypothetical protein